MHWQHVRVDRRETVKVSQGQAHPGVPRERLTQIRGHVLIHDGAVVLDQDGEPLVITESVRITSEEAESGSC
jgi:hypothetical protein